jgi:hypothetical protein
MTPGSHKGDTPSYKRARDQSGPKAIRPPPCKMSDPELMRIGIVAKYMCSQEANLKGEKLEAYALQLKEVQTEWIKRFPTLPLSTTFERDEPKTRNARRSSHQLKVALSVA